LGIQNRKANQYPRLPIRAEQIGRENPCNIFQQSERGQSTTLHFVTPSQIKSQNSFRFWMQELLKS